MDFKVKMWKKKSIFIARWLKSNDAVKGDDYFLMRNKVKFRTIWYWMPVLNIAAIRLTNLLLLGIKAHWFVFLITQNEIVILIIKENQGKQLYEDLQMARKKNTAYKDQSASEYVMCSNDTSLCGYIILVCLTWM
jgi:hypothetical protein